MPPKDWNELTLSQQPAIDLLVEHLGYTHISGDTLRTDYRTGVILEDRLATSLKQINPFLDDISINKVIRKMTHPEDRGSSLIEINSALHEDMIKGISIKMDLGHGIKGQTVWYIDFENPENNDYLVVDEFRVKGQENCRADLVLFVNGLPLVVIECKSPRLTDPMFDGIDQLRRYQNVR